MAEDIQDFRAEDTLDRYASRLAEIWVSLLHSPCFRGCESELNVQLSLPRFNIEDILSSSKMRKEKAANAPRVDESPHHPWMVGTYEIVIHSGSYSQGGCPHPIRIQH